jgi:hypothetical protein
VEANDEYIEGDTDFYLFIIADHVIVKINAETREAGARGKVEVKLRAVAQGGQQQTETTKRKGLSKQGH